MSCQRILYVINEFLMTIERLWRWSDGAAATDPAIRAAVMYVMYCNVAAAYGWVPLLPLELNPISLMGVSACPSARVYRHQRPPITPGVKIMEDI